MQTNVELTKGFTLETNPADLASGKGRATVYLGVGTTTEAGTQGNACCFNLGRNAKTSAENGVMLTLQAMKFNNIDFSVHKYFNYMDKNGTDGNSLVTVTQNYFMNMSSQGLSFSLSELSIKNCTFSGMVRGFIRFQRVKKCLCQFRGFLQVSGHHRKKLAISGLEAGSNRGKRTVVARVQQKL